MALETKHGFVTKIQQASKRYPLRSGAASSTFLTLATRLRRGETARRSLAASLLVLYRNPFGLKAFDLAITPLRQS